MVSGGLAARDGHNLIVVADADVLAATHLRSGGGGGIGGLLNVLDGDGADVVGVVGGVGLAEQLERDVAGEGGPALRVEGAEAGKAGGEGGVVAAAHGELDGHVVLVLALARLGLDLVLAVRGGLLDAADHARGDVAQEGADADDAGVEGVRVGVGNLPLLRTDLLENLTGLGIIELLGKPRLGAVGQGRVDSIHDARKPGLAVHSDAGGVLGHPLAVDAVEVGHFLGRVPAVRRAPGEGLGQHDEAVAVALVGEQRLVVQGPDEDGRGLEAGAAGVCRVEAREGLLQGLQGPRDGRRAQVHEVGRVDGLGEELEAVDVEGAQPLA
ncbi:hypothetical protein VM1G_11294 [Cytospora mali]|uniref:Uncharacterized protein n=1 Tax=Cytospora mali TaxID=578113 RepID=A0A194VKZ4_CYTMA|nr:hypothetical protein VM1G_11294 [Valsa mali]